MTKLKEQAYDTEKVYSELGIKHLEEYARITGLLKGKDNLDFKNLLAIFRDSCRNPSILEVGCGYGRVGQLFLKQPDIDYWGIDLHKEYTDIFRANLQELQKNRVLTGNFLKMEYPFEKIGCVLFSWSVIGDFSSNEGQISALKKSRELLYKEGRVLLDVPVDIVNKFDEFQPGYFNIHERYDLSKLGLSFIKTHPYITYTDRKREIIELESI